MHGHSGSRALALGTAISLFSNLLLSVLVTPQAACVTADKVKRNLSHVRCKRNEEHLNNEYEKRKIICVSAFAKKTCFTLIFMILILHLNYLIIKGPLKVMKI